MTAHQVRDAADLLARQFIADGFVTIENAVPSEVAQACTELLWAEIGKDRDDEATWTQPVHWSVTWHRSLFAGDVYLCHPFLVHAAQPHYGRRPRFMAQPPLYPATPLRLTRDDGDYSPVEQTILQAIS